jgi:hypothetical protein
VPVPARPIARARLRRSAHGSTERRSCARRPGWWRASTTPCRRRRRLSRRSRCDRLPAIDAPCTQYLRHGDLIHARKALTAAAAAGPALPRLSCTAWMAAVMSDHRIRRTRASTRRSTEHCGSSWKRRRPRRGAAVTTSAREHHHHAACCNDAPCPPFTSHGASISAPCGAAVAALCPHCARACSCDATFLN